MKCSCFNTSLIEPYLEEYAANGNLITVLQKSQELYGYLSNDLLAYISRRTGVKPAKITGVVTFYAQFRTKPAGKHLILICQGTACHVNGSADIETAVKDYLKVGEGEISENGLFTFNNVACLGCCSLSPVMMIGDETYGALTPEKAKKVLRDIKDKERGASSCV